MMDLLIVCFAPFIRSFYDLVGWGYRTNMILSSIDEKYDIFLVKYNIVAARYITGRPLSVEAEKFLYYNVALPHISKKFVGESIRWKIVGYILLVMSCHPNSWLESMMMTLEKEEMGHLVEIMNDNSIRMSRELQEKVVIAHGRGIKIIINPHDDVVALDNLLNKL